MVTLYHWDLPNALDEQFGGLLNDSFRPVCELKLRFFSLDVTTSPTSEQLNHCFVVLLQCSEMFTNYADLCFQLFGDSVKLWTTFNEPQESSIQVQFALSRFRKLRLQCGPRLNVMTVCCACQGYGTGGMAPGRCSNRASCAFGNSSVEPYIVGHNILKAHAATAQLYKSKYQVRKRQKAANCGHYNVVWRNALHRVLCAG